MNAFTVRMVPSIRFKRSEQPRVLRSIVTQPPQYHVSSIAARTDGAIAALAIRGSQIEAQRRARRAGA